MRIGIQIRCCKHATRSGWDENPINVFVVGASHSKVERCYLASPSRSHLAGAFLLPLPALSSLKSNAGRGVQFFCSRASCPGHSYVAEETLEVRNDPLLKLRQFGLQEHFKLALMDIQLWSALQRIGIEMASLAKSLSDMSLEICHEQLGVSVNNDSVDGKQEINQVHPRNKDCLGLDIAKQHSSLDEARYSKPDQADVDRSSICKCCGGKTDDRICIVCDSCEKIYHVFCVGVSVNKDSPRSWYCMNCVDNSLQSSHQNCVVCERVHVSSTETHVDEDKRNAVAGGVLSNGSEKSYHCMEANVVQQACKSALGKTCKLCKCEFTDDKYRECEHHLCRNMFHLRCLSELELKRFGPYWYCPSCLCRVCLVDQDDEKIVLCDGCDNAYHIYCMEPPRNSIPMGKWFCRTCDTRLQAIRKAKRTYENHQKQSNAAVVSTDLEDQKKGLSGTVDTAVVSLDMLLSAAGKLKNEEKLVQ